MIEFPTDIALLSIPQIQSLSVLELKNCCKILGLRGYSKLNKPLLIDLVFKASDIERQTLTNERQNQTTVSERQSELAKLKRQENALKQHPIELEGINNLVDNKLSPRVIANTLFKMCSDNYADLTIAKGCTKRLNAILPETKLTVEQQHEVRTIWREQVYAINYARREQEKLLLKSYAREAVKHIDSKALVSWATENLTAKNYIIQGLALALLSGRRMVEIYGTTTYKLGSVGIIATGLAKKKAGQPDYCEFIPLCDRQLWLDCWNQLEKRNFDKKQINGSISKLTSRHFPQSLKDLDIHKFKDCRDVYAAIAYQTFGLVARDAIPFTKQMMGHETQESTAYYRKYDCEPLDTMQEIFQEYIYL